MLILEIGDRQKKQLQLLQDLAQYTNGILLNPQTDGSPGESSKTLSASPLPSMTGTSSDELGKSPPEKCHCALIKERHANVELQLARAKNGVNPPQECIGSHEIPQKHEEAKFGGSPFGSSSSSDIALNRLLEQNYTVQDILDAGIKALSQQMVETQSTENYDARYPHQTTVVQKIIKLENQQQDMGDFLPNVYQNNIRVNHINLVAACIANLGMLGMSVDNLDCEEAESCFFGNRITQNTASSSIGYLHLKRDLRPIPAQHDFSHHPYIDCIPFPDFRNRLIKMIDADPEMEYDFCKDLEKDGLICWGSALNGQSQGVGSGAPWDMRSWEAQPWFIKKWWLLVGGPEGDMYKQSRWWCEMRGDTSSYPWQ